MTENTYDTLRNRIEQDYRRRLEALAVLRPLLPTVAAAAPTTHPTKRINRRMSGRQGVTKRVRGQIATIIANAGPGTNIQMSQVLGRLGDNDAKVAYHVMRQMERAGTLRRISQPNARLVFQVAG